MGHAAHFLRRLDRLADPQVELALRLYNDPDLLSATLKRARLPDGADRVAIAIEDPEEGPFLVVTREGRFVTCLGRGMHVGTTPVVTREQLDAAARDVERMREVIARARFFDSNQGLLRKKFLELFEAGPYVSREQFEDIARWEPLLGSMCLSACVATISDLMDARRLLKNITRPHPKHEARLLRYHQTFYLCAHLYVLAGISQPSRALLARLVDEQTDMAWAWPGVRSGVGYLLYRTLWSTARMGKVLLPGQKRRLRSRLTHLGQIDGVLGTAAIGLASDKLRAEARKALRGPRTIIEGDPRIGPCGALLDAVLDLCFDDPETMDTMAVRVGQHVLANAHLPEPYRWERFEDVPVELARAQLVGTSEVVLTADRMASAFWHLPWLVRAEPGELYPPADLIDVFRRPPSMEDSIGLLEMQRDEEGVRQPRRVEKKPSRNDPCSCESGKKYKRCCGA